MIIGIFALNTKVQNMIDALPRHAGSILILNGPNLSQVGRREPEIYGSRSLIDYLAELDNLNPDLHIVSRFTPHEGELIEYLYEAEELGYRAAILNAGGYTHTSIALADAVRAVSLPIIEVHISQTQAREVYRHTSLIAPHCRGSISGFGLESYTIALEAIRTLYI